MEQLAKYPSTRWFVMITAFFGFFSVGMMLVAFSPVVGLAAADYGITPGEISFYAFGIYNIVNAAAIFASGPLFDKFGIKPVFFVGSFFTLLGAVLVPVLTHTLAGFVVIRILLGIGQGPTAACLATVASRWFPPHQRSLCTGIVSAGIYFGMMLSFTMTSARMEATGGDWRAAVGSLMVGPIVSMILAIIMMFVAKESELPPVEEFHGGDGQTGHDFAYIVKQPVFYLIILAAGCYTWVLNAFNDLTPGYMAIDPPVGIGHGPVEAGMAMTLVQFGNIFAAVVIIGILIQKVLKGRSKPVIVTAFLVLFFATLSIKFEFVYDNPVLLRVVLFVAGVGIASIMPSIVVFITTNLPATISGRVYSMAFGVSVIFAAIGISVGAGALHATGTYQLPIIIVSIVSLVGFIPAVLLYVPKRYRSHQSEQSGDKK